MRVFREEPGYAHVTADEGEPRSLHTVHCKNGVWTVWTTVRGKADCWTTTTLTGLTREKVVEALGITAVDTEAIAALDRVQQA